MATEDYCGIHISGFYLHLPTPLRGCVFMPPSVLSVLHFLKCKWILLRLLTRFVSSILSLMITEGGALRNKAGQQLSSSYNHVGGVCDKGGLERGMVSQWRQCLCPGDSGGVCHTISAHPRVLQGILASRLVLCCLDGERMVGNDDNSVLASSDR